MTEKLYIGPGRPGLIVYNFQRADMRPVLADGEYVDPDPQWLRYLADGDVKRMEPPSEKPKISKKGDEA